MHHQNLLNKLPLMLAKVRAEISLKSLAPQSDSETVTIQALDNLTANRLIFQKEG